MSDWASGISGALDATSVSQLGRFKIAIAGRVKTGKSWLACTMPGKKYVFDFDSRKESIAGKPDVVVKTYQDITGSQPKAQAEFEKDLNMFEYNAKSGKAMPDVFILDSMTWWTKAIENDLMKTYSSLTRTLQVGGKTVLIPAGWDVITAVRNSMENSISRLSALGHVICIFHEEPEKDTIKSTAKEKVYTGSYAVHPHYLRTLLSTFNETWRLEIIRDTARLTVKPSEKFGASTTLLLDATEVPDIAAMIAKHLERASLKP